MPLFKTTAIEFFLKMMKSLSPTATIEFKKFDEAAVQDNGIILFIAKCIKLGNSLK